MENDIAPEPSDEPTPICISCLEAVDESTVFCPDCRAPLSYIASSVPFYDIFAEGFIYRKAIEKPQSLISLIGVWVIFGFFAIIAFGYFMMADFKSESEGEVVLYIGTGIFFGVIGVIGVCRCTGNYISWRKQERRE